MSKPKCPPRNPMPKTFTAIVPLSLKAASETYQFAPAVRIGDQILISGIVGFDAEGRLPPDFRGQAENEGRTVEYYAGMIGVTLFGLFLTPVFYVGLRRLSGLKLVQHGEASLAHG